MTSRGQKILNMIKNQDKTEGTPTHSKILSFQNLLPNANPMEEHTGIENVNLGKNVIIMDSSEVLFNGDIHEPTTPSEPPSDKNNNNTIFECHDTPNYLFSDNSVVQNNVILIDSSEVLFNSDIFEPPNTPSEPSSDKNINNTIFECHDTSNYPSSDNPVVQNNVIIIDSSEVLFDSNLFESSTSDRNINNIVFECHDPPNCPSVNPFVQNSALIMDSNEVLLDSNIFEPSVTSSEPPSDKNNNNTVFESHDTSNCPSVNPIVQNNALNIESSEMLFDTYIFEPSERPSDKNINNTVFECHATPNCPSDNSIVKNNAFEQNDRTVEFYGDMTEGRKRKRKADPTLWKRNKNKQLRLRGESYIGFENSKQVKKCPERKMGDVCNSKLCDKSSLRQCQLIKDKRLPLFEKFWKEIDWDQRKVFVINNVLKSTPKRRYTKEESKRSCSFDYYLPIGDEKFHVCKKTFLSTFNIGEYQVFYWIKNGSDGMHTSQNVLNISRRESRSKKEQGIENQRSIVERFLDCLPKLPSHYARRDTTRVFLEPGIKNFAQLYSMYMTHCKEDDMKPLCMKVFSEIFKNKNLAIHQLKKDKCDTCCKYEVGNLSENDFSEHKARKDRARSEKEEDKNLGKENKCTVLTMDLQSVKVSPSLNASAVYYKTKLTCHNFTVMNIINRHVTCFWFSEIDTDLCASSFASCVVDYLKNHCSKEKDSVIIYSDGCTYQNRNIIMANALLSAAATLNIVIEQKFLEKGHTQMECDSVHSAIERKLQNREIYLPSDYIAVSKEARIHPTPYDVTWTEFSFFSDFSQQNHHMYKSLRPGKCNVVTDIRGLRYTPNGEIYYKLDFDADWMILPQRKLRQEVNVVWPPLNATTKNIKYQKFKHLQELKKVIPTQCHSYYDNLPHETA